MTHNDYKMNSLNNDVLYYIGNFLEFNERIYFFSCISLKNQLFLILNNNEKLKFICVFIKIRDYLNLLILKSHMNIFKENLIDYCVKYYNKKILTLFLNNISYPLNCFNAIISSFKDIDILKILLKYEEKILDETKCLECVKYYSFYYKYSITKGCAIDLKNFKYYLLNSQYVDKITKTTLIHIKHLISKIYNYYIYLKNNGMHSNLIYRKMDEKIMKFIIMYYMFKEIVYFERDKFNNVIETVFNSFKSLKIKYNFFIIN
jgi:hypothetical protein